MDRILVAKVPREALVAGRDCHLCVQWQVRIIVHPGLVLVLFFFYLCIELFVVVLIAAKVAHFHQFAVRSLASSAQHLSRNTDRCCLANVAPKTIQVVIALQLRRFATVIFIALFRQTNCFRSGVVVATTIICIRAT